MLKYLAGLLAGGILAAVAATPALATHSWNGYHWARTANPFTVSVVDSMTTEAPAWDTHLGVAVGDWTASSVLDVGLEPGDTSQKTRRRCPAVSGKVRACNAEYGQNGWLGLASISVSGKHITQGTAKMNDSYFNTPTYNYPYKKQHVVCQEIGHDWGLGHQSETGEDLGTCMDYARSLDNEHPDRHDYEQLESDYSHLDSTSTLAGSGVSPGLAGSEHAQPRLVERDDRITNSVITEHFADGTIRITHIFWAIEERGRR